MGLFFSGCFFCLELGGLSLHRTPLWILQRLEPEYQQSRKHLVGPHLWVGVEPRLFHPGRQVHLEFQGPDLSYNKLPTGKEWPAISPTAMFPNHPSLGHKGSHTGVPRSQLIHLPPMEGKISLRQPQGFSCKDERTGVWLTLLPRGDVCRTRRRFKTNAKKTGPSIFSLFLYSFNKYLRGPRAIS